MKRIVGLSAMVLALAAFPYAQDPNDSIEKTGWICRSQCVNHDQPVAACDTSCRKKSGDVVFVDEQGNITKISNPHRVQGHIREKVKVKCQMKNGKLQIDELLRIYGL
jgi:hypothetical protein